MLYWTLVLGLRLCRWWRSRIQRCLFCCVLVEVRKAARDLGVAAAVYHRDAAENVEFTDGVQSRLVFCHWVLGDGQEQQNCLFWIPHFAEGNFFEAFGEFAEEIC